MEFSLILFIFTNPRNATYPLKDHVYFTYSMSVRRLMR